MFLDNVNWKFYRSLPRWPGIGHLAEVEQEKNDEDKLIFFSHAKCSGNIRKLVYCTDGVRKISPLQGDGNYRSFYLIIITRVYVRQISPL